MVESELERPAGELADFESGRLVRMSAPVSIPHNNELALFEDTEQNVWVGTQGGMLRLQPGAAAASPFRPRLDIRERSPLIPLKALKRDPHLEMHTRGG